MRSTQLNFRGRCRLRDTDRSLIRAAAQFCTAPVAVTSLTLDRQVDSGCEIMFAKKLLAKISARRKNFVLLCRTVEFESLIHHGKRTQHKWRIPQYTKSSISSG
jgi:hypothetical protein